MPPIPGIFFMSVMFCSYFSLTVDNQSFSLKFIFPYWKILCFVILSCFFPLWRQGRISTDRLCFKKLNVGIIVEFLQSSVLSGTNFSNGALPCRCSQRKKDTQCPEQSTIKVWFTVGFLQSLLYQKLQRLIKRQNWSQAAVNQVPTYTNL